MSSTDQIVIYGARQHNLKNISLSIPRNRFVVITGVSGSGKSSLAFDTLFAEGQRRYVEALSTFARQFLQRLDPPEVDAIEGLSPAIAIEQKGLPRNPRSTVGTLTQIYDYLRLLYARMGVLHCSNCRQPVLAHTIPQMVDEIHSWPQRSRLIILAPLGTLAAKELPKALAKLRRDGFMRIRLDGQTVELDPPPGIPSRPKYQIDVVVDRLILDYSTNERLSDSLELAAKIGARTVIVQCLEAGERLFTEAFRCASCNLEFPEPTPSLFSFHHPTGMCQMCRGSGYLHSTQNSPADKTDRTLHRNKSTPEKQTEVDFTHPFSDENGGVICPQCFGTRLNQAARSVLLGGLGIHEASRLTLPKLSHWLKNIDFTPTQNEIAARPRDEAIARLSTLEQLGLSYLSLDRSAPTLSGGEAQRIRLANQLGNPLAGVLYVLDEPSIGLHARDHQKLLQILFQLRDSGNSVVVVEHDRETILQADYVVDLGPGAGVQGGEVIFSGSPQDMRRDPTSLTGRYLAGLEQISFAQRRQPFTRGSLTLSGASGHNLKGIQVSFPIACMTCVTGVSGSGKSTLVLDTLYRALARKLYRSKSPPAAYDSLEGTEQIQKVILIDQSPLGRTPRSTPATYTGLFDLIRQLFSKLPEARARGYDPGRFSFNARGGRCESCKGEGLQTIEMFFLPDIYITCPVCHGSRYSASTLEILFKGRSIADVLDMTVLEAAALFENLPSVRRKLQTMQEVGLGYLRLGQPATTLSGGEAQRVKLAAELALKTPGKTLYILDEPTSGLHFDDIRKLLHVLHRLVDLGHTVVIIEHHLDVIKTADYVLDLGPEGGENGGYLVAAGAPEEVARVESSITGRFLREALK
jgi:excinuclease ABC subunit A